MDERTELRRRILLKSQALKLIRAERKELRRRLFLLELKEGEARFSLCGRIRRALRLIDEALKLAKKRIAL